MMTYEEEFYYEEEYFLPAAFRNCPIEEETEEYAYMQRYRDYEGSKF